MSSSKRKESTPAGFDRSFFLRWNRLQLNTMDDPRFRGTPTLNKAPKITSQARLIVGAQPRILDARNMFDELSKSSESPEKEVDDVAKVLPSLMDVQRGKSNPFEYFKQHRFDKELDLSGWFLGPITSSEIASGLFSCSTVSRLFLANNRLGNEGGKAVAKGLKENFSVKELDLSGNMLGQHAVSAIGKMLNKNQTLEKLNLSRNDLTDQDVGVLLNSLCQNTVLKDLDLSNNILCDQFAHQMSHVLENNNVLEQLSISSNHLQATGLQAMMPGLQKTGTLHVLNISWNYLYDVGAEILGEIIAENESLIEISACGNLFTAQAAGCLAKGVANNSKLKVLRVGQNLMRNSGVHEFFNVLSETNPPITRLEILDINGTLVDKNFKDLIETELATRYCSLKIVNLSFVDEINDELAHFIESEQNKH